MLRSLSMSVVLVSATLLGCGDEAQPSVTAEGGGGAGGEGAVNVGGSGATGGGGGGTGGDGGMGGGPIEGVEAFVAVGWGGRRIASCDGGETWIGDQQDAPEGEDDWHRSYTPKSLAYGDGAFVFLTGWGTDSSVHVTRDGVSWTTTVLDTTYGAVGYDGARFVLVGNRELAASTDGGQTWAALDDAESTYDRAAGAFAGVLVAGADGQVETMRPGETWQPLSSCQGARHGHIGFEGGFAVGGGILISLGHDGDTCAFDIATGTDLGVGQLGNASELKPHYFDGSFVAATGDRVHRSTDGVNWTSSDLPSEIRLRQIVKGPAGGYAAVGQQASRFFYSADGDTWNEAQAPIANDILYLATGTLATCGPR